MPKRPKSGPPYTDIPSEVYVVVAHPWGMERNPRSRSQQDYDRVASWAQFVLQQGGLSGGRLASIECIFSMGTRDEIIIQFSEGTNVIPLLGEHRWAKIARNWQGAPNDDRSTRVFLYNWRDNGDPANHNWSENFPKRLPLESVPARSPYPTPSWTSPSSSLANFVLPIPRPPNPVPERRNFLDQEQQTTTRLSPAAVTLSPTLPENEDQRESEEQSAAHDSVSSNLFRPYQPPLQHPARVRFLNQQTQSEGASSPQVSPKPPKLIKKLDPYELEEDALSILRAPGPIQEDTTHVKDEKFEPVLTLSVNAENQEIKSENESHSVPRVVPLASLGYRPSAELEEYINAHLRSMAATPSSASDSGVRAAPKSRVTVKREYEEDSGASLVERKRFKIEEI